MRVDVASLNGKAPKRSWYCGRVLAHDNRSQTNGACRGGSGGAYRKADRCCSRCHDILTEQEFHLHLYTKKKSSGPSGGPLLCSSAPSTYRRN